MRPIYLIAERFGQSGGGEAIKAYQYARALIARGRPVVVFTHARSLKALGADFPAEAMRLVPDTAVQRTLWRLRPLRWLLGPYFHLSVRRMILAEAGADRSPLLHFISPVSPVEPRLPPKGFETVYGPLTGNIYYPPGFQHRMSAKDRIRQQAHKVAQIVLGRLFPEKRRARAILVSGYERTRASLRLAGCADAILHDVVDSGVNERLRARPRIRHSGENGRFVCSGRMVDHKGIDLAIRAVAETKPPITLDIFGDGDMRPKLEALVRQLGLEDRVRFLGWIEHHEDLIDRFSEYRGYLFPSLAEANGIVMQEAMMAGLPVVTLRWGGPERLADDTSALYLAAETEAQVATDLAAAMTRLAGDAALAETVSQNARRIAEERFSWDAVTHSWETV